MAPRAGPFERIARDHVGLDLRARGDHGLEPDRITRENGIRVGQEQFEDHAPLGHERVLGHLAQPGAVLAFGEGREEVEVGDDADRLVERPDQVLALGQVHGRLPADRGVDHREQRRRDLHQCDAAVVHGGGEAGGVADDAATERHDGVPP